MNIKIKNKQTVSKYSYNQLIKFFHIKDFNYLIHEQQRILSKTNNIIKFRSECKKAIEDFLRKHKIPNSWVEPIYNLIKDNTLDFPYDNSISLKVGVDEITENTKGVLLMKNIKTGRITPDNISIVITGKVSIDQIVKFIKEHKSEIENWQTKLELPAYKRLTWKDIDVAMKIIEMKDKEKLSFSEITDRIHDKYFFDENTVKTIYYRFKERLNI